MNFVIAPTFVLGVVLSSLAAALECSAAEKGPAAPAAVPEAWSVWKIPVGVNPSNAPLSADELEAKVAQLGHVNRRARADAAALLGKRGDERAVGPLLELLASSPVPTPEERGVPSGGRGEEVQPTSGLRVYATVSVFDPDEAGRARAGADRVAAVEALGAIGGDQALDALARLYEKESMDPYLLQAVARAVARIDPATARELLEPDLRSPSGAERIAALSGLADVEDADLSGPIAALLDDEEYDVRKVVVAALHARPLDGYRDALRAVLEKGSEGSARAALEVLSARLDDPLVETVLGDLAPPIASLTDCRDHGELCREAGTVLARAGAFAELRPRLVEYLEKGEPWDREHAAKLILRGYTDRKIGQDFLGADLAGLLVALLDDQGTAGCAGATAARALVAGGWKPDPALLKPRDADEAAKAYLLLILFDRDESIPLLEEALMRRGDARMFRTFNACGRPELKRAAEQWLPANRDRFPELRNGLLDPCAVRWDEWRHLR